MRSVFDHYHHLLVPHNSRERNKTHARKTRERKKNHMMAYASRIKELEDESASLRSRVDSRYTASVLLGLGNGTDDKSGKDILSSSTVCGSDPVGMLEPGGVFDSALADHNLTETVRRVRRRGKYTPQERETIRRERNRIHAKKTRDKKKIFMEASETMIMNLEKDVVRLRQYLRDCNLMTEEELEETLMRDRRAALNLATVYDPMKTSGTSALAKLYSSMEGNQSSQSMVDALFKGVTESNSGSGEVSGSEFDGGFDDDDNDGDHDDDDEETAIRSSYHQATRAGSRTRNSSRLRNHLMLSNSTYASDLPVFSKHYEPSTQPVELTYSSSSSSTNSVRSNSVDHTTNTDGSAANLNSLAYRGS
jgi:hypothetical protein